MVRGNYDSEKLLEVAKFREGGLSFGLPVMLIGWGYDAHQELTFFVQCV